VTDEAEQPVTTADPAAVADAGRLRRPSSLRAAAAGQAATGQAASSQAASSETAPIEGKGQRPKPSLPQFPGKLTPPSFLRRSSKPANRAHSTDPVAADAGLPQEAGPSPSQKLVTLVSERPEVGLGIAFAAGLVIASILKRLAR
jgi:hypothetical protein